MHLLSGIFFLLFFIIIVRLLSKFFFRAARHLEEKERKEDQYRRDLLDAISGLKDNEASDEVPIYTEMLLNANKELIQKEKVRDAIENELGVDMDI